MNQPVWANFITRMPYRPAWDLQRAWAEKIRDGEGSGVLLLLEHPPVFTTGRRDASAHIHATPDALKERGIDLVQTDRGGLVTYHGPGQLVGYPIVHLGRLGIEGVAEYVSLLERLMQAVCRDFGLETERVEGHQGVFVGREKIGAVGVHVDRQVTTHGFALNVDPDLTHYDLITPCGLSAFGVTSLARHGIDAKIKSVAAQTFARFAELFNVDCLSISVERLLNPPRKEPR